MTEPFAPRSPSTRDAYIEALPVDAAERRRIRMTVGCDDCRSIPKVAEAGTTTVEDGVCVQIMHNGVRVVEDGYCGRWMTEIIRLLDGHHEPQEERAFHALLRHLRPARP